MVRRRTTLLLSRIHTHQASLFGTGLEPPCQQVHHPCHAYGWPVARIASSPGSQAPRLEPGWPGWPSGGRSQTVIKPPVGWTQTHRSQSAAMSLDADAATDQIRAPCFRFMPRDRPRITCGAHARLARLAQGGVSMVASPRRSSPHRVGIASLASPCYHRTTE